MQIIEEVLLVTFCFFCEWKGLLYLLGPWVQQWRWFFFLMRNVIVDWMVIYRAGKLVTISESHLFENYAKLLFYYCSITGNNSADSIHIRLINVICFNYASTCRLYFPQLVMIPVESILKNWSIVSQASSTKVNSFSTEGVYNVIFWMRRYFLHSKFLIGFIGIFLFNNFGPIIFRLLWHSEDIPRWAQFEVNLPEICLDYLQLLVVAFVVIVENESFGRHVDDHLVALFGEERDIAFEQKRFFYHWYQ